MGCCGNRGFDEREAAEDLVLRFESSLPISKHKASVIIDSFQVSINKQAISSTALSKTLKSLGIEKTPDLDNIIQNFSISNSSYNSRKLLTFVLLISKGEKQEKLKLLFNNYSSHEAKTLESCGVLMMIQDIYQLALEITPLLAARKSLGNHLLNKYRIELSANHDYIINYLKVNFDDKVSGKKITLSSFLRAFSFREVACLLEPSLLRQTVQKILKITLKAQLKVEMMTTDAEKSSRSNIEGLS